jgi:hypothetical protein
MARVRAAVAMATLSACTILRPLEGISDGVHSDAGAGSPDAPTDGPSDASSDALPDGSSDAPGSDVGDAANLDSPDDAPVTNLPYDATCSGDSECVTHHCAPDLSGTRSHCICPDDMVAADTPNGMGKYCVDRFEATRDQYNAFVAGCEGDQCGALRPAYCSFNTSFEPIDNDGGGCPPNDTTNGQTPIVCIDWCDAFVFCARQGKRLCNRYGQASTPYSGLSDPTQSEWFNACSLGKTYDYPYGAQTGNNWDPSRCNGQDGGGGVPEAPVAVGTTACEGAFPGIFDMSGNVAEWESSCNTDLGPDDRCRVRGGGFDQDSNGMKCGADLDLARSAAAPTVGIRCCGG